MTTYNVNIQNGRGTLTIKPYDYITPLYTTGNNTVTAEYLQTDKYNNASNNSGLNISRRTPVSDDCSTNDKWLIRDYYGVITTNHPSVANGSILNRNGMNNGLNCWIEPIPFGSTLIVKLSNQNSEVFLGLVDDFNVSNESIYMNVESTNGGKFIVYDNHNRTVDNSCTGTTNLSELVVHLTLDGRVVFNLNGTEYEDQLREYYSHLYFMGKGYNFDNISWSWVDDEVTAISSVMGGGA